MDRDTARELRELKALVEFYASRTEALTRLIVSIARYQDRRDDIVHEMAVASWGDLYVGAPSQDARSHDLVASQVERLAEAAERTPLKR